jgi:RNA polymerase sigma-70 factor (ECF subfamily)
MSTALDRLFADAHAAARAAWPTIDMSVADFAAYLRERAPAETALESWLLSAPIADLYLACACAGGNPAAHTPFDALLGEVDAAARAVRASPDVIDEVKQLLRAQLLLGSEGRGPAIGGFAGRGSLRAWIRISATRELVRQVKRQQRDRPLDEVVLDGEPGADPLLDRLKQRYRVELKAAVTEAIAALDAQDRTLLRHQLIDHLTLDQIAALYGVHRATGARWLAKVRAALAGGTQKALAERLELDAAEVSSVIRMVRSRFDVSVDRLLAEDIG